MIERLEILRLAFEVVGWRNGAKRNRAGVFFFLCHEFVDLLGEFAGTDNQQAGCQWVQRAGMTNFFGTREIADFSNGIEGRPAERFVNQKHSSFFKTVYLLHAAQR